MEKELWGKADDGEKEWLAVSKCPEPAVTSFLLTSLETEFKRYKGHSMERISPSILVSSHLEAATDSRIFHILPEIVWQVQNKHRAFLPSPFFQMWEHATHTAPFLAFLLNSAPFLAFLLNLLLEILYCFFVLAALFSLSLPYSLSLESLISVVNILKLFSNF